MSSLLLFGGGRYGEPAPTLDLNFAAGLFDSRITFSRADATTCATYRDGNGVRQTAAADIPRFDHDANGIPLGLLMEVSRTNYLLNSTAPVTQTTGSLANGTYTLWPEGAGSVEVAANTATITGAGVATEGSPVTFTVTSPGTVDVTVTGSVSAFQLENGAFATSLIVTAGATATRAVDNAVMTSSPWLGSAGVLYAELATVSIEGANRSLLEIDNENTSAGSLSRVGILVDRTGVVRGSVINAGSEQGPITGSAFTVGVFKKMALAYAPNDLALAVDGSLIGVDSSATIPSDMTALRLAANPTNAAVHGSCWIKRVASYPARPSNAVLQSLTTL